MNTRSFLPSLAAAAGLLLTITTGAANAADRLEEWSGYLPKGTVGVISIKNSPEVSKDWDKSALGRFLEDEDVKKWMAPGLKEGGSSFEKAMKEESGMTFSEQLAIYPGAMMAAFVFEGPEDFADKEGPSVVSFAEIAGKEAELKASKDKELEAKKKKEHPDAVIITADLAGQEVGAIAESGEKDAEWISAWCIVDGVAVESNDKDLLESTLAGMKNAADSSLKKKLARLTELSGGSPDVSVCIDLEPLIAMGKQAAQASMAESKSPMPFSPDMIFEALGVDELQALAFAMDMNDEKGSMDMFMMHTENPVGIIPAAMRGSSTEVPQPAFVPADVDSASVSRQRLGAIWDALMKGVEKLGPMAGMMTGQIAAVEQQVGLTIKNDLFGALDDTFVDMQVIGAPISGSIEPNISKVTMLKLKDRQRFNASLEAIKKLMGNGFAMFEETEFEGNKIFAIKSSLTPGAPGAPGGAPKFSYVVTDEYVLFAQGAPELLHKVLIRLKRPEGDSAWDSAEAQAAIAALPKDYTGVSVSKGGSIVKMMLTTIAQVQNMAGAGKGKAKGAGKGPKGPAAEDAPKKASGGEKWFDTEATPPDSVFAKYFGTGASGVYSLPDAVHIKYITLPVAGAQ